MTRPLAAYRSSVFVFNPFAEGYLARGKGFAPVRHQAMLAEDLANVPQFLCAPGDIVLVEKPPAGEFLEDLELAGFSRPEFVTLRNGRIDSASGLGGRRLGALRPWAWGPDSVELLAPLFPSAEQPPGPQGFFHEAVAQLYSKAWGADFLKKVLAHCPELEGAGFGGREPGEPWLCPVQQAGVAADSVEGALEAVAKIRDRGHLRVVVKQAFGLAGSDAIRLWEPEVLPAQQRWIAHAVSKGRTVVVEPWLEREMDFSIQLEMGRRGLELRGYTGLINDRKGQFLGNWAEPGWNRCPPARAVALCRGPQADPERLQRFYEGMFPLLEAELLRAGFAGPVSVDALIARTPRGGFQLKPVVEINPRYTMGRLTLELMRHASPATCGRFRLITADQARAEGFEDLPAYARALRERRPICFETGTSPVIARGAVCLNDPAAAQVCLATFEVEPEV